MSRREAIRLVVDVVDLIENEVDDANVNRIARKYAGNNKVEQLKFLNRLYNLIKLIPVFLWENEKKRGDDLKKFIRCLETATIRELGEEEFLNLSNNKYRNKNSTFREIS